MILSVLLHHVATEKCAQLVSCWPAVFQFVAQTSGSQYRTCGPQGAKQGFYGATTELWEIRGLQ